MSAPRRYLLIFFILGFAWMGMVVAINYAVDPYGFYRPAAHDFFPHKPAVTQFEMFGKFAVIKRQRPDTVIIGSSRADYGLNPDHPALGDHAYNAALKGMTIAHLPKTIRHAIENGATRIIIAVDFFMFNANMVSGHNLDDFGHWHSLLSVSTLKSSFKTILRQRDAPYPSITTKGLHTPENLENFIQTKGIDAAFDNQQRLLLSRMYFPAPSYTFDIGGYWDIFTDSLTTARQNDVDIAMIVNPVHADTLVLIRQAGLWDNYKNWRNRLHETAHDFGLSLRDYTGVNDITTDYDLFWDNSHYRTDIGDMILGQSNLPYNVPIEKTQDDLIRYECENPQIVTAIRRRVTETRSENRLIPRHSCVSY